MASKESINLGESIPEQKMTALLTKANPLFEKVFTQEYTEDISGVSKHIVGNLLVGFWPLWDIDKLRKKGAYWFHSMQKKAEYLERLFQVLDNNPELAKKLRTEGFSSFPTLEAISGEKDGKSDSMQCVEEIEKMASEKFL